MSVENKKIISIPFGQCFLDSLVQLLRQNTENDPLLLANTLVLLPTRRAILGLQIAFQKSLKQGEHLMVPRMMALADIETENQLLLPHMNQLPPAISDWKRLGFFTQLIQKFQPDYSPIRAIKAAEALMHLVDEVETTGVDLSNLDTLVGAEYAAHWQITLDFLKIITDHWPLILKELDLIEPKARERQFLLSLSHYWKGSPPLHPVIIAGTTGTVPATAELVKVISELEQGLVVLPGFDPESSQTKRELTHPQHTLQNLLTFLEKEEDSISVTKESSSKLAEDRLSLIQAAMNNENLTLPETFSAEYAPQMIECSSLAEEAQTIALIMRYSLKDAKGPIALVSPNQALCSLVEVELQRWELTANTSSGKSLARSLVGGFLIAVSQLWSEKTAGHFLALLKHPLCYKHNRSSHLDNVRVLEKRILRPFGFNLNKIEELIEKQVPNLKDWFIQLAEDLKPILSCTSYNTYSFAELLDLHLQVCFNLTGGETENSPLWQKSDGSTAKEFIQSLKNDCSSFPSLETNAYAAFFNNLLQHAPTIHDYEKLGSPIVILGALEARLSNAEVIILGGLNENSWPPTIKADPWLSRSMRQQLGLPPLERRLGLSAHDFCSCFYAKNLYLTRSTCEDGTPTIPSRWWQRLQAVATKNKALLQQNDQTQPWLYWVKNISPKVEAITMSPPEPRPPIEARPKHLSATEIERLIRDPYSIYAKHCLKLKPLPELDRPISKADLGQTIHSLLDSYFKLGHKPEDGMTPLLNLAAPHFEHSAIARTFWWHRFQQIAEWFIEALKKDQILQVLTEQKGSLQLKLTEHDFTLTAVADRLDCLTENDLRIIDYKTGQPPSLKDIQKGYAPQLAVEALIASRSGFQNNGQPKEIAIWHLKGGEPAGRILSLPVDEEFIENTELGLLKLLSAFLQESTPFLACPLPEKAPLYNDYAHLERLGEWLK